MSIIGEEIVISSEKNYSSISDGGEIVIRKGESEIDFDNLSFIEALWRSTKLGILSFLSCVIMYLLETINLYFIGKEYDNLTFAACGLARSIWMICFVTIYGMLTSLETLGSQAWGARNLSQLGFCLKRGIIITLLTEFPSILLSIRMDLIILFGQDPKLSRATGLYIRSAIPYAIIFTIFWAFGKFLIVQRKFIVFLIVLLILFPVHILISYTLISVLHLGLTGAALSLAATFLFGTFIFLVYICIGKEFTEQIYPIYSPEIWREWKEYFVMGLYGTLMYAPRLGGIMLIAVLASYLGTIYVEINAIIQNTYYILFCASIGSNLSTSILTGNALGYGALQPLSTIKYASFTFAISTGIVINGILLIFRREYFGLYISEKETLNQTMSVLPCIIIASIIGQLFSVIEGILRGCGELRRPANSNYIPYLLILFPLAYIFAFYFHLQLIGLWIAWDISLIIALIWYIVHLLSLPMDDILLRVNQRVNPNQPHYSDENYDSFSIEY